MDQLDRVNAVRFYREEKGRRQAPRTRRGEAVRQAYIDRHANDVQFERDRRAVMTGSELPYRRGQNRRRRRSASE